jgi:hypothetical protein
MPGPAWGSDTFQDEIIIATNIECLIRRLVKDAPKRLLPSVGFAHGWHRDLYAKVPSVPSANYLGGIRGTKHPDLIDCEVGLIDQASGLLIAEGVPANLVAGQLKHFEKALIGVVRSLDAAIPPGAGPRDRDQLNSVVLLAASVHGEWVRIHPYANGNGRVARVWANWVLLRYDVPPVVRIKLRPGDLLYGPAALASMGTRPKFLGNHDLMYQWIVNEIRAAYP